MGRKLASSSVLRSSTSFISLSTCLITMHSCISLFISLFFWKLASSGTPVDNGNSPCASVQLFHRRPCATGTTTMFITRETKQNHFRDVVRNFSLSHSTFVNTLPGVPAEFPMRRNTKSTLTQGYNPINKSTLIPKPEIIYTTRCPDE